MNEAMVSTRRRARRLAGAALLVLAACMPGTGQADSARLFPLSRVRLTAGPLLEAQQTDLRYMLALDADRLLAPFLREAGLVPRKDSYGNWESSGLDGHMGGHYLSALALMFASTGDVVAKQRLDYVVAELARAQQHGGDGYLGGIPGGRAAFADIANGALRADSFSVNGKWVPWYNLHKLFAGLRDAVRHAGSSEARTVLLALSDWTLRLCAHLSPEQMQTMLQAEHGGMNEVLADVAEITGDRRYLELAMRFSHQAVLGPLQRGQDQLTGLHANTQIPKVIGFVRIGALSGQPDWEQAARFFWQTVRSRRTVAIGGNSVREHFHDANDFSPMVNELEGPETCNSYNMLKLTELLFEHAPAAAYADYYERALYNHILASQRPETGGFVYFTPMRPNHYRVYSQPDQAMWCCVGSGIESHARHGAFIYAHQADQLYVNLFVPSVLDWEEKQVRLTQSTRFPDQSSSRLTVEGAGRFTLNIRYPEWVAPGRLGVRVNGRAQRLRAAPGQYVRLTRDWRSGDRVDLVLPMRTRLEQMPDRSHYYAVLHGPIVLAAKTAPFADEKLNVLAGAGRMDHSPNGAACPLALAPMFIGDPRQFARQFKPVPGQPLTFSAPGLIRGKDAGRLRLIPFFRLHDSRYMLYWPASSAADYARIGAEAAQAEAARQADDALTVDRVAPGEQQPEADHGYQGEGSGTGFKDGRHWRRTTGWFSYELNDPKQQARRLRLVLSSDEIGKFDLFVNGQLLASVEQGATAGPPARDFALPPGLAAPANGKLTVRLQASGAAGSGPVFDVRLLR